MKKTYISPRLIVHGDVRRITLQGGGGFTDVPEGTICCDDITGS